MGALVLALWVAGMGALYVLGSRWLAHERSRARLAEVEAEAAPLPRGLDGMSWLARWLYRAGYRHHDAPAKFLGATLALTGVGGVAAFLIVRSGLIAAAARAASIVPGGVGDLAIPVLVGAPWFVFFAAAAAPVLVVRADRRRRVEGVERDMPLALEMLATLSEAGLGFDAAIAQLIDAQTAVTPLVEELRLYQTEVLGGVPRVQALRHLKQRIDVSQVNVFVSALIQAEQGGAALTEVLRRQAEDARSRNRERALIQAEALPTKLVFPLVICYLPGLFVTTLGPAILQFAKIADSFARARGG